MGVLAWIGRKVLTATAASMTSTATTAADIVDRFVETQDEQRAANLRETASMRDFLLLQAQNNSVLGAGWVGALGWTCTVAFGINFVATPLVAWWYAGHGKTFTAPVFDTELIVCTLAVLLGLPLLEKLKAWPTTKYSADTTTTKKPEPKEQKEPTAAGDVSANNRNTTG